MIRALKVALIAYGVLGILWGLAFIFIPRQLGVSQGYESWPKYSAFFLAVLGTYNIAPSVFLINAARDPIRHVSWVKFAIFWAILSVIVQSYSIIRGYITFSQTEWTIVMDGGFAVAFLVLYPWRLGRSDKKVGQSKTK